MSTNKQTNDSQRGFTLVETLMAIVIMAGGLLALATAFAQGMIIMSTSHYHQMAKEKASEAIESVFTSRDTITISWDEIRNVDDGGVFLNGEQPLKESGDDGLVNTIDDEDIESITLPGPDNQMGTSDDVMETMSQFTREIAIEDIGANGVSLRRIVVTIRYQVGHLNREYQLTSYISPYA
ncbi:MAG: prepilin-type N-terminal cleavage/methylation domain-containing protein [Acidobacteria bacterium]|nr:prepilin-type N-terminal cleavage/methylation domain-containing protein [Acidobacteriota bacterium]